MHTGRAQLAAVERYQGALADGQTGFVHTQSLAIAMNGDAMVDALRRMIRSFDDYRDELASTSEGSEAILAPSGHAPYLANRLPARESRRLYAGGARRAKESARSYDWDDRLLSVDVRPPDRRGANGNLHGSCSGLPFIEALELSIEPVQRLANEAAHVAGNDESASYYQPPAVAAADTGETVGAQRPRRSTCSPMYMDPDGDQLTVTGNERLPRHRVVYPIRQLHVSPNPDFTFGEASFATRSRMGTAERGVGERTDHDPIYPARRRRRTAANEGFSR